MKTGAERRRWWTLTVAALAALALPMMALATLAMGCVEESDQERFGEGGATSGSGGHSGGHGNGGALTATGTSTGTGTGSGTGTGTGTGSGTSTGTNPPPCVDNGPEPNQTELNATDLGTIDDCDGSGGTIEGELPSGDTDWYVYDGLDGATCVVSPTVEVVGTGTALVCAYADCPGVAIWCPADTTGGHSPQGLPGCCGYEAFTLDIECDPWSDDATIYMRVTAPPVEDCVHYALLYNY